MPGEAFTVEKMRSEDLEAVLRIETASFTQPWTREMFAAELIPGMSLTIVARSQENDLVGYLCGVIVEDTFYISNIAVDPQVRRRGVGRTLLVSALAEASRQGAETASLEVRASNIMAQELYRQFGFTQVGRRRRYYIDPAEDALIMCLDHLREAVTGRFEGKKA